MRYYEVVYLISNANNHYAPQFALEITSFISANGGKLQRYEVWGEHRLAFKINNCSFAFYFCLNIECTGRHIIKLEEKLKSTGIIIRYLIVKLKRQSLGKSIFLRTIESFKPKKKNEKKGR